MLGSAAFFCALSPVSARTLGEALALTYSKNPQIISERNKFQSAIEDLSLAMAQQRPTIDLSAQRSFGQEKVSGGTALENSLYAGLLPSSTYSITISQPLFHSGQISAAIDSARSRVESERAHLLEIEQAVFLTTATDFLDVCRDQSLLVLARENEENLARRVEVAQGRVFAKAGTQVEVAEAESAYQMAKANRLLAESVLTGSRNSYLRDVGEDALDMSELDLPVREAASKNDAVKRALTSNPAVLKATFNLKAADADVKSADRDALPTIDMQAYYSREKDASFAGSKTDVAAAIVRFDWKIYQGGKTGSQIRRAEATRNSLLNDLEWAQRSATADATRFWDQFQLSAASVKVYLLAEEASRSALNGVEAQYLAGSRNFSDVLDSHQSLLKASQELIKTKHDMALEHYQLSAAIGTLNAAALALPVQLFKGEDASSLNWKWF